MPKNGLIVAYNNQCPSFSTASRYECNLVNDTNYNNIRPISVLASETKNFDNYIKYWNNVLFSIVRYCLIELIKSSYEGENMVHESSIYLYIY